MRTDLIIPLEYVDESLDTVRFALHEVNLFSNLCKINLGLTEQVILRCYTDYFAYEDSGVEHRLLLLYRRQVNLPDVLPNSLPFEVINELPFKSSKNFLRDWL